MEDFTAENIHPPAGSPVEDRVSWLFGFASSTNARFKDMHSTMQALQSTVDTLPDKIMARVNPALDRQTEAIRPIILDRDVREATAKAADEALARRVAQAQIKQTPIAFWGMIFAGLVLVGAAFGAASKYVHIGAPDGTTTTISTTETVGKGGQ